MTELMSQNLPKVDGYSTHAMFVTVACGLRPKSSLEVYSVAILCP